MGQTGPLSSSARLLEHTKRRCYRTTCTETDGEANKTTLLTNKALLKPKLVRNVKSTLTQKRMKQKYFYDKCARRLPPIHVGDDIRIRGGKIWEQGHVMKRANVPRSFVVQSGGQTYHRSRWVKNSRKISK